MTLSDSILTNVKSLLDIQEVDTSFDDNLIISINSVMMVLHQLGVGPTTVFSISGSTETWSDFLPTGTDTTLSLVKNYVALKVKETFDPSASGIVSNALKTALTEYEARLAIQAEDITVG